jgi:hypothetical protein
VVDRIGKSRNVYDHAALVDWLIPDNPGWENLQMRSHPLDFDIKIDQLPTVWLVPAQKRGSCIWRKTQRAVTILTTIKVTAASSSPFDATRSVVLNDCEQAVKVART